MAKLPEAAAQAWTDREGPVVLTTVDEVGVPNTIYVTCVHKASDEQIIVADNKMDKTQANLKAGSRVNLLYITKEKKAYQIKGTASYEVDGDHFNQMKNGWLAAKFPGKAAVVVTIEAVYSGAEKLA
jgi:uncharacterized protein